ncbi:B12-binding domain-containing radical SAM protein [Thermodesulfobacteriota bacterium]
MAMLDILFVQNYYEHMLSVMQLSAVLKQHGFSTDVTLGTKESIVKTALEKKPRVIGFYCTTGIHHKYIAAAVEIKKVLGDSILTLFGGPHPTFVPDMINEDGVDIICRGEGEYALTELLQALAAGSDYTGIQNLSVKKDGIIHPNELRPLCDLDELPHPDREIYRNIKAIHTHKRQEVMFGRGCPFDCTFCSAHAFRDLYRDKGRYVRFRSIDNIMAELEDIKRRYSPTCFFFHDDTFIVKKDYCYELLRTYKEKIALPFSCLIRADLATDELIGLLKECGCYFITFGIECGNEKLRNSVLKKRLTDKDILRCSELLHAHKIPFATFNMVGLPDEHLREVWDTVALNIKAKPVWAWFSVYQTLPETELAHYALHKGYLASADVSQDDATFHESSIILRNDPEGAKILRLKNMANLIIKCPVLLWPVETFLLNLPLSSVWGLLDKILYFLYYFSKLTYKQGLLKTAASALFMARHLKEFK